MFMALSKSTQVVYEVFSLSSYAPWPFTHSVSFTLPPHLLPPLSHTPPIGSPFHHPLLLCQWGTTPHSVPSFTYRITESTTFYHFPVSAAIPSLPNLTYLSINPSSPVHIYLPSIIAPRLLLILATCPLYASSLDEGSRRGVDCPFPTTDSSWPVRFLQLFSFSQQILASAAHCTSFNLIQSTQRLKF